MTAAETAITIDDVVTVINSGRLKEKSFDPYTAVSTLQVPHTSCLTLHLAHGLGVGWLDCQPFAFALLPVDPCCWCNFPSFSSPDHHIVHGLGCAHI